MAVSNNYHSENTSNVEMTNKSEMRPSLLHCRCNTDSSVDGTRRITIQQQRQHLFIHYTLTTREYFSACHQSKCKCFKLRYQTKHELTTGLNTAADAMYHYKGRINTSDSEQMDVRKFAPVKRPMRKSACDGN